MRTLIISFLLLLLFTQCFSLTVVNSLDGRDLVSGIYYSALKNDTIVFAAPGATPQSVYAQIGTGQKIQLIQSATHPAIVGMADSLTNAGNQVQIVQSDDPMKTNLDLAKSSGAKKFVVVDPVYGYNTVSVLAYAKQNGMYLIFMDKSNAQSAASLMKAQGATDILIYGFVDKEAKDAMNSTGLTSREINNGDKFDDNMQLADLYFAQNPSKKQIILSDGNAFDSTTAAGDNPVVLISPVIPTSVYQYIKDKVSKGQVTVAMLVDQEYAQTAYNLKTSINTELGSKALSVLVKIGEGAPGSGDLPQVALFPLPGPALGLNIDKVEYNTLTQELDVTYANTGNALEYVKPSMVVLVDGQQAGTVGDEQPFTVDKGQKTGRSYPIKIENGEVSANITAYFGSSKKSFENGIQVLMNAGKVQFIDTSVLEIKEFTTDATTDDLFVTYANIGNVSAYFRAGAAIEMNGSATTIKDDNTYQLAPGAGRIVKFPGIAKTGSRINASADYGAREAFLDKRVEKAYATKEAGIAGMYLYIAGAGVIILVVLFILLSMRKKGRK